MPKQFDLLIFDWDGTLMDSTGVIVNCVQAACHDLGLPVPSREAASHIIGLGLTEAMQTLLPELPVSQYERMVERYRHHYLGQDHVIPLFPGVFDTIRELHDSGYLLTVATGKSRKGLDRALMHSGLEAFFHGSRCADECHSKPHPQMILELMDEQAVTPERTLMIGDTTHDLQMALNAGVASLGACYGAHPHDALLACKPLHCAHSFEELRTWLMTNA